MKLFIYFFLRKAGCHMQSLIWCVWSLVSLTIPHSPTNGPWELVGRVWKESTTTLLPFTQEWSSFIREGHALQLNTPFQEGGTWSGEEGWIYPPSQPDQLNQPWQSMGWQVSQTDSPHTLFFSYFLTSN